MRTVQQIEKTLEYIRRHFFERGDLSGTLQHYQQVLSECEQHAVPPDAFAICCRDIADVLFELHKKPEAYAMYDRALSYKLIDLNIRAHTLMNKGISLVRDGRAHEGVVLLQEALTCAQGKTLREIIKHNLQIYISSRDPSIIPVDTSTLDQKLQD